MLRSVIFAPILVFALASFAQQTAVGQTTKTDMNSNPFFQGQPFESSIDDVIVRPSPPLLNCELNAPCTGDCKGDCDGSCQYVGLAVDLSESPETLSGQQLHKALFEADEMVARLTGGCEACAVCACTQPDAQAESMDQYCEKLAVYLAATIDRSEMDSAAKQRTIKAAFEMVAEKKQSQLETDAVALELEYHKSLEQQAFDSETFGLIRADIQRIEKQQIRTLNQLSSMNQYVNLWGSQMQKSVSKDGDRLAQHLMVDEASLRQAREREVAKIKKQMEALDVRMHELQQNAVQPARHLEPLYSADQLLKPIAPVQRR